MGEKSFLKTTARIEIGEELYPYYDAGEEIYKYGVNNSYPDVIDTLVRNSVSASSGLDVAKTFLLGRGFGRFDEFTVNERGETLENVAEQIAEQLIVYKGFALHVDMNLAGEITGMRVIPFKNVRLGKMDDDGNIVWAYLKDWQNSGEKAKRVHLYNDNKEVIERQIASGEFNGSLIYFKMDGGKFIYPYSRLHAVRYDMDAEAKVSLFKRNNLNSGFVGKKIFVTPPFDMDAEDKRRKFRDSLKKFLGIENIDSILHLEVENYGDSLENVLKVVDIKADINDKMFEWTEESVAKNIRIAFKNIPELLVRSPENSLFGVGGEVFKNAEKFYERQWLKERAVIERWLKKVLAKWTDGVDKYEELKIIPFYV